MPFLRPFRALRYDAVRVPDLGAALCPPYDVISNDHRERLLARHPRNAVRLESPSPPPGDPDDARYAAAAREFVAWRTDGTLHKDQQPSVYSHLMRAHDGGDSAALARGFFCRLRLEPLGRDGGVRPHERTMSGPKEDRFRLLRATGVNISPVVLLYDSGGAAAPLLDELTRGQAARHGTDDGGIEHELWVSPCRTEGTGPDSAARRLLEVAGSGPLTIADGHHRYETALRYQEERGQRRACESDPAYDFVMALLYDLADLPPAVLPTHRIVRDVGGARLLEAASTLFDVRAIDSPEALLAEMSRDPSEAGTSGSGRFGCWTREGGAVLRARREAFEPLVDSDATATARWLDVTLLARAIDRLLGVDAAALESGGRLAYTKDASEAVSLVATGTADVCFLLDPTPVEAVTAVAAEGGVMPPKSTYFHPKAPTGLVFNPLET